MIVNRQDLFCGAVFILIGVVFGAQALGLPLGTALRMGPGYFPLVLAATLILLGAIIALKGIGRPSEPFGVVPWRGLVLTLFAVVAFGYSVRGIGLVPAIFMVAFVSAFGSRRMTPLFALAIAVALTIFCVLVFHTGLGITIPLFGPWLGM